MKINSEVFRVREGDKVDLGKWPTNVELVCHSKKHSDDKDNGRLIVSQIIPGTLEGYDMPYPETIPERRQKKLLTEQQLVS